MTDDVFSLEIVHLVNIYHPTIHHVCNYLFWQWALQVQFWVRPPAFAAERYLGL